MNLELRSSSWWRPARRVGGSRRLRVRTGGNLEGLGAELLSELGSGELVEDLALHPDDPRRAEPVLPRVREPEHHVLVPASVTSDEEDAEERERRHPKGRVMRPERGGAHECLRKVVVEYVFL